MHVHPLLNQKCPFKPPHKHVPPFVLNLIVLGMGITPRLQLDIKKGRQLTFLASITVNIEGQAPGRKHSVLLEMTPSCSKLIQPHV